MFAQGGVSSLRSSLRIEPCRIHGRARLPPPFPLLNESRSPSPISKTLRFEIFTILPSLSLPSHSPNFRNTARPLDYESSRVEITTPLSPSPTTRHRVRLFVSGEKIFQIYIYIKKEVLQKNYMLERISRTRALIIRKARTFRREGEGGGWIDPVVIRSPLSPCSFPSSPPLFPSSNVSTSLCARARACVCVRTRHALYTESTHFITTVRRRGRRTTMTAAAVDGYPSVPNFPFGLVRP